MYKNILEKLNFNMEEIKLFDSFAGIGSLHQSLKELGVPTKLTGISEIDVDAIISYAAIHIENFKDLPFDFPSEDEMRKYLIDRNIGYNFEKQKSSIPRMKKDKLKWCYKATILTNNMGDVGSLDFDKIPDSDLFNFSFPCTNVSNAGKQEGFTKEDGSITRSGLYIYGIEAIKAKKFKYVMIENVKGLIQKKFINDFYNIINEIEALGYNCCYPKKEVNKTVRLDEEHYDKKQNQPICLNAKDYGIPQNRERIFVICIRKDIDNGAFKFPKGRDYGVRLKHILEDYVDEKYYLSQEIQERFKLNEKEDIDHNELNVVGSSAPDFRTIGQRDMTYGTNGIMSTLTATDYKQPKQIIDDKYYLKDTKNFFIKNSFNMEENGNGFRFEPHVKNNAEIAKTITTQAGARMDDNFILDLEGINESKFKFDSKNNYLNSIKKLHNIDFRIRKLTPKECFRLMGFRDEHIDKIKELGIADSSLYKMAGNSIVVNCLYYIFKNLLHK